MEKSKEMADEIRTAAHGEARKRNKSQDNANAVLENNPPEEETKELKSHSNHSSNLSSKKSEIDNLDDPEVD
jgi:hypothetical protein